jgi:integrase
MTMPVDTPVRPRGRKRANGEGSIYQRVDGLWVAAITGADGRRQRVYAHTRADAGRRLTQALQRRDQGMGETVPAGSDTVAAWLESWLTTVKPTLRPRTWIRYGELCRVHLIPAIGRLRLGRLQPAHLQALYAERLAAGSSPTTIHHVHMVLHRALVAAVRQGQVNRNVAELVTPPRMVQAEMRVLDPTEVRRLCALAAEDADRGALLILAVTTGMRQGELLALRWRDVDLERGTLAVTGTLQRVAGEGLVRGDPKTVRSRRQVRLTPTAVSALRQRQAVHAATRLQLGERWKDGDWVFTGPRGTPLDGNTARAAWRSLSQRADLPMIRFHDLRHTAATLLLGQGVHPKVVADLLGHATVAITLDRYSHVAMAMHQEATDALEAVLQDHHISRVGSKVGSNSRESRPKSE